MASGTATLEASIIGTPMIVLYRVQRVTMSIVRMAIRLGLMDSETISLPNLILETPVVPEVSQERLSADRVVEEAKQLLADHGRLAAMREQLSRVSEAVDGHGSVQHIADLVEELGLRHAPLCQDLPAVALEGGSA